MERYEVVRTLGKGAGGKVILAFEKGNGRHVAIKEIILDPNKKSRTKEAVVKEASILAHLKHPHVVSLQESFFDSSEELLFIVQVRRDLKSQNVFLTKKGVIKIGDFGIARMMENTFDMAQTCCGTPCYLSPELCQDMPYSSKADVWALGCLLFEMCALRYAFDASNFVSLFYKIVKVDHGEVPPQYSSSLGALIKQLLSKSPDDRPSAGTVLNLPFVQEHLAIFIKEKENLQEALHAKQLLKTVAGNRNKSPSVPQRPSSAEGMKSPDANGKVTKARCKSAQPMNRAHQQIPSEEKKETDPSKQADDPGEYSDDFDESADEEYSDEFEEDSELNGDSLKKPVSATKLKEKRDEEEAEDYYPDDFEDDSEEDEVLDDILTNARAAQDAEVAEEEFVEDLDRPSSCKQKLKEHVITVIGERMFEEVRERFARGEADQRPEFEKLTGSEMMETCYLVNELFIGPEEQS
ncbi:serine/threonine-protein kinase Nek1-like [Orbicella faveolata]|uniref:serine/threonine-protein kinase Nek1-like n=1 Tax=Orbicella faveolata TaxID=48498 RepID=UPI0009E54C4B|nr:serine/threonine-protein kinase Nek1-like [Orbicella faveolata]